MRVLIACEYSGTVRDAFTARGHYALSCDMVPPLTPGPHHQGDVRDILNDGWDLMIAHPPCERLCVSGARWKYEKEGWEQEQDAAIDFVCELLLAPIPRIALENPIGIISTRLRKPDQVIQPWMFGHAETKATCLWLKNLPLLIPTSIVWSKRLNRVHKEPPGPQRKQNRAWRYQGIAAAMADQWDTDGLRLHDQNKMTLFEWAENNYANSN